MVMALSIAPLMIASHIFAPSLPLRRVLGNAPVRRRTATKTVPDAAVQPA